MMGLAIAHQAREQVLFDDEVIYASQNKFNDSDFFNSKDRQNYFDYGEQIVVI